MMKKISQIKEFYDTIEKNKIVVSVWKTTFCPDCLVLNPFLPEIEAEFEEVLFVEIDRNEQIELSKHLEVYGVPSFIIFKDGEELGRLVNKLRKSKREVSAFIRKTIM